MIKGGRPPRCAVIGCCHQNAYIDARNVSYFRLPTEKHRAKLWLAAIGRNANPRLVVCEMHFEKNLITCNNKRKRLATDALPTLHLPPPGTVERPRPARARAGPVLLCHQAIQTHTDPPPPPVKLEPPDDYTPEIDIFVKEETVVSKKRTYETAVPNTTSLPNRPIKREKTEETEELNTLIQLSSVYLDPELAKFVKVQALVRNDIAARGKECDENLSLFALKLYHAFPQTYKLMQKSLGLPSMVQIKRLFQPLTWEVNEQWARLLRARFEGASPAQRDCVVCVARAPLRPAVAYVAARDRLAGLHELDGAQRARVARTGVVLVARGVNARWRQPLACCLLGAGTDVAGLRLWIDLVISKLFDIGLNVRALITDFDDNFVPTGRAVTPEMPYFTVKDKQIYCFYDCTQLMLKFRDFFMMYDVNYGGLLASWADIEEMYDYNSSRAYPLPTGLTEEHVRPERGAVRRSKLAVEALAQPVAAALATAVDLRVLDDSAHGTVQLVSAMSALYETMHSKVLSCATKTYAKDNGTTKELKFLNEMLVRLEKTSLVEKRNRRVVYDAPLVAMLCGDVRAALALFERVRRSGGLALPMRAFNNDPLHEFFDRLRALDPDRNPTGKRLLGAFKKSFVFNILKSFKTPAIDGEMDAFLRAAGEVRSVPRSTGAASPPPAQLVPVDHYEAMLRVGRGRRAAPSLARHLLDRCLLQHPHCEPARVYCQSEQLPEGLLRYMEVMAWKFITFFNVDNLSGSVLGPLLRLMADDKFEAPCDCFPTLYLKTIFFRFKIRNLIEFNNNRMTRDPDKDFTLNTKYVDLCRAAPCRV